MQVVNTVQLSVALYRTSLLHLPISGGQSEVFSLPLQLHQTGFARCRAKRSLLMVSLLGTARDSAHEDAGIRCGRRPGLLHPSNAAALDFELVSAGSVTGFTGVSKVAGTDAAQEVSVDVPFFSVNVTVWCLLPFAGESRGQSIDIFSFPLPKGRFDEWKWEYCQPTLHKGCSVKFGYSVLCFMSK